MSIVRVNLLFIFLLNTLILNFPLAYGDNSVMILSSDDLAMAMGWKSQAEEWAKHIKFDTKLKSNQRQRAFDLYTDAKSSIDEWVYQIQLDLDQGTNPTLDKTYQNKLGIAATKTANFIGYSKSLYLNVRGSGVKMAEEILESMTDVGIKIWDAYRGYVQENDKLKQEKSAQLRADLSEIKWIPYSGLRSEVVNQP